VANAWFSYPFDNPAGETEPFGGGAKPDSNVQCPDGTPITALLSGTISGLNGPSGEMPAWGAAVTIRLDKPINQIATHTAYLHLQPLSPALAIGQHVDAGALIGYSGGGSAAGAQKVPVGFALYNGDIYGFGPTWGQYLGNPLLNPYPVLRAAAGGNLGTGFSLSTTAQNLASGLSPSTDVSTFLWALDQALILNNPFNVQNVQMDTIAGVTFTDPFSWISQFGQNCVDDFSALTVRAVFLVLGLLMLYKVASAFVDFGAVGGVVSGTVSTATKAAALL